MKQTITLLTATIILLLSYSIAAQNKYKLQKDAKEEQDLISAARDQLLEYLEASKFNIDSNSYKISETERSDFKDFFVDQENVKIIFDVPVHDTSVDKNETKRYLRQGDTIPKPIFLFGKQVSPDMYLKLIENQGGKIRKLNFKIDTNTRMHVHKKDSVIKYEKDDKKDKDTIYVSKVDTYFSSADSTVVFEVRNFFYKTKWILADTSSYYIEINVAKRVTKHYLKIKEIRRRDEDIIKQNVQINLVSAAGGGFSVTDKKFKCNTIFKYKEAINTTDSILRITNGKITLRDIPNRATILIKKIRDHDSIDYVILDDWDKGKKVSSQPDQGFELKLQQRKWSGRSNSIELLGGYYQQGANNTGNFNEVSDFTNGPGFWFGGSYRFTQYFHPNKWNYNVPRGPTIWGLGTGLIIVYKMSTIHSDTLAQNKYWYEDTSGDTCQVQYSGKDVTEYNRRLDFKIPVYGSMRTKLSDKVSLNINLGVNVIIPFQINYTSEGDFSRWGYYEDYNDLPITNDPVYNYYTGEHKKYKGTGKYAFHMEGEFRLNFLINLSGNDSEKHTDNSLIIGLLASAPLIDENKTYSISKGKVEEYEGYWINTENDEYHSLVHSKSQPFNFFIDLTVGINLVRFVTK